MTQKFVAKDGTEHEFPDTATPEQIASAMGLSYATPTPEPYSPWTQAKSPPLNEAALESRVLGAVAGDVDASYDAARTIRNTSAAAVPTIAALYGMSKVPLALYAGGTGLYTGFRSGSIPRGVAAATAAYGGGKLFQQLGRFAPMLGKVGRRGNAQTGRSFWERLGMERGDPRRRPLPAPTKADMEAIAAHLARQEKQAADVVRASRQARAPAVTSYATPQGLPPMPVSPTVVPLRPGSGRPTPPEPVSGSWQSNRGAEPPLPQPQVIPDRLPGTPDLRTVQASPYPFPRPVAPAPAPRSKPDLAQRQAESGIPDAWRGKPAKDPATGKFGKLQTKATPSEAAPLTGNPQRDAHTANEIHNKIKAGYSEAELVGDLKNLHGRDIVGMNDALARKWLNIIKKAGRATEGQSGKMDMGRIFGTTKSKSRLVAERRGS